MIIVVYILSMVALYNGFGLRVMPPSDNTYAGTKKHSLGTRGREAALAVLL